MKIHTMVLLALLAIPVGLSGEPGECEDYDRETRTRRDCQREWRVVYDSHKLLGDSARIVEQGEPYGELWLACWRPGRKNAHLYIDFIHDMSMGAPSWIGRKSPFRVGLWEKILPASGEGEYTLKHTVLHYHKATSNDTAPASTLNDDEAAGMIRRMYHSESISWTSMVIGRSNTKTAGESSRKALEEFMEFCGISYEPRH